ncbi:MAG: sigma-70 family RNA polymerase sigma factor, partial [Pseudomonadota bacterium]
LCRDLTQDALLLVVAKAREGLIEHPEALSAYVRKVGENKLIAFRRKQKRQRTDTASDVIDRMVDTSGSLVANVRKEQLGAYVRTVLSELGRERDQEILKRHYLVGESKDEICSALDLSRSQADVVLHRARHRLKELILQKEGDGSGPRATDLLVLVAAAVLLVKETAASLHFYRTGARAVCAEVLATRRQRVARYG